MFTRRTRPATSRRRFNVAPRARLFLSALERREVPAVFTVSTLADGPVSGPGQLVGSLRQALFDANAAPGADEINITATGTLNMAATVGDFIVASDMAITGPGATSFVIKGAGDSRIFNVSDGTSASINVSMSGMTLTGGAPQVATGAATETGSGGAILVRNEKLALDGMIITGNKTPTVALDSTPVWYRGGAIAMSMSTASVNSSSGQGGALTINNCQIDSNTAGTFIPGVLMAGDGGGIWFASPNKGGIENSFSMINSTVSGNVAAARGGGVYFTHYNGQPGASFLMVNSTVSSNVAQNDFGGGVVISGTQSVPITILNSTITNNSARSSLGGGLVLNNNGSGSTTTPTIEGTIIADNFGNASAPDIYSNGASVLGRSNIFGSTIGFSAASGSAGNITGTGLLAPLANNGGITLTHMPLSSSLAVDAGSVAAQNLATLSSAVSSTSVGFITVNSTSSIAIGQQFQIDAEIMTVMGITASTVTVTRGASGTTAATHANNAPVKPVVINQTTVGSSSISSSATTIKVTSSIGLNNGMPLQIDSEIVWISAPVGSDTISVVRGKNGTTAATHLSGTVIRPVVGLLSNLSAPLGSLITDTTVSVFSGQRFGVGMKIQIDSEIMTVTAVSGNTLTVVRGTLAAHGVNSVVLLPYEQRGASYPRIVSGTGGPRVDIGAVEYDPNVPAAFATAPSITAATLSDNTITVVFTATGGGGVDLTTLNNVFVTGPNAFNLAAVPTGNSGPGTSVTATYTITAPVNNAAGWEFSDNGLYSIQVNPGAIKALDSTPLNTTVIGQFGVAIGRTLTVNDATDVDDGDATNGITTLREAINLANATEGGFDTIAFDTTTMGTSSITVTSQMLISDSVVINPANVSITLDGGSTTRFLEINGPGILNVNITGLTFQNGSVTNSVGGAMLLDNEIVTLTDCNFLNNTANKDQFIGAGAGGAIYGGGLGTGSLTIVRGKFENNVAGTGSVGNSGGAISLGGVLSSYDLTITDSSFTNNTAQANSGGAINMSSGSLRVYGSTFEANTASGRGGAVAMVGAIGSNGFLFKNSTVSGNRSEGSTLGGGGLYLNISAGYGTTALIANTTITRNTAVYGPGGGINLGTGTSPNLVDLENSIIAQNVSKSNIGPDLSSLSNSSVINVKANNSVFGIIDSNTKIAGAGNQSGTNLSPLDAMLAPLANNGGPTRTHRPIGGSPAVDYVAPAITNVNSLTTLNGAINASQTTITMTSATAANIAIGNVLQIDSETMTVTAVSSNTVTVTRLGGVAHSTLTPVINNTVSPITLTSLNGAIDASQTTITLAPGGAAAAGITKTAPFNSIQIDQEVMTVTNVAGDVLTVTRGADVSSGGVFKTLAAAHSNSATVSRNVIFLPAPAAGGPSLSPTNFGVYILVDNEIMLIAGQAFGTGQTSVFRGQAGTSMAAHSLAASVYTPQVANMGAIGAIDNVTTTLSFLTAPGHVAVGSYLQVDAELMLVTGVSGTSVTVTRGVLSTTAAAHAGGAMTYLPFDQRGNGYPRVQNVRMDAGAMEIDNLTPVGKIASLPVVSTAGGGSYSLVVTYTDNSAVDGTTIKGDETLAFGNIKIVPPSGPDIYPTYTASSPDKGSTTSALTYSVTYTFTPPGGLWDSGDNGSYLVYTDAINPVTDLTPTPVEAHQIGTLKVGIAQNLIVTNNADSGIGSLRYAIEQSNFNQFVTDTITFDTTVFNISTPQTITLGSELLITDQVLVTGPGSGVVTVTGNNVTRVFTIDTPLTGQMISLSGMTITGGNGVGTVDSFVGAGGILNNDEALIIDSCVITGNTVTTVGINQGGGIAVSGINGASLTIKNSTISNNSAAASGGGIFTQWLNTVVNIQSTTISGNRAGSTGGAADFAGGQTGAIRNGATITIDNSTFNDNVAVGNGGAVRFGSGYDRNGVVARTAVTNSTFYNNVSFNQGGAIFTGSAMEFTLLNSTISGNYAMVGGGGFAVATNSASVYTALNAAIVNSVIAGNTNKFSPDIQFGNATSALTLPVVNSFIGAVNPAFAQLSNQGSTFGSMSAPLDAKLGPPTNNGGPVKTMVPLPGSPLINAGSANPIVTLTKTSAAVGGVTGTTNMGASSINMSATTIQLTSATGITTGMQIQIDSEFMLVTAVSGDTVTVTRGTGIGSSGNGSLAATHAAGSVVTFDTGVRTLIPYWGYHDLPIQVDSEAMMVFATPAVQAGTLSQVGGIDSITTAFTIQVATSSSVAAGQKLMIDNEIMTVVSFTSPLVIVTRGTDSTIAAAHGQNTLLTNLTWATPVVRAQNNTTAAAHTAGADVNRAALRYLSILSVGTDSITTSVTVADSRTMFAGMNIQVDAEIMTVVSVDSLTALTVVRGAQSTTAAAHSSNAFVSRPFLTVDARGSNRQIGTIDIGAVEVDPTTPFATGSFAPITTKGGSSYSFNVVYTDDTGLDTASFNSNNVKVTAPDGITTIAVTYNPGDYTLGVGSATVKYSIPAYGGPTWQTTANGFYDISIKAGTAVTDTSANPVYPASLGSLHVAIVKSLVVTNNNDSGPGSLRDAILEANANVGVEDIITFDSTVFNTMQIITMAGGEMEITDPVTITGPGVANVTVDAAFQSRAFLINLAPAYWSDSVTMTGMKVANGVGSGANSALQGATIRSNAGGLVLDNMEVTGASSSTNGGGIMLAGVYSPMILSNSNIHHNTVGGQGSAIYIGNNGAISTVPGAVSVTITNTIFDSNSGLGTSGSGTLAIQGGTVVTVDKSSFTNNTMNSTGGAIFQGGGSLVLSNSTITNNAAINPSNYGGNAGGLYFGGSATATISSTNISSNSAGTPNNFASFGALGNGGGVLINGANVTMSNVTINNNFSSATTTTGGGGGLFMSNGTVTINDSTLSNNSTLNNGGGAALTGGNLTLNRVSVSNNVGLYPYNTASSTVAFGGGGLFMTGSASVTVNSSTISGNTAPLNGGGILVTGLTTGSTSSGTLLVNGSTISGNVANSADADTGGGGLFVAGTGGMVLVTNTTISGNSAASLGGGVLVGGSATSATLNFTSSLTIRNSTIAKNTAVNGGGGMHFDKTSSATSITLMSTIVSDNTSTTAATGNDLRTGSASTKFNTFNTLVGDTADFGPGTVIGTLVAGPANLSPTLVNYGGPTKVHTLGGGSTAIDAGSIATDLLTTVGAASVPVSLSTTTITVTNSEKIRVGTRLIIDSEVMTVASVISATSITVNRAQQGTIAASHAAGANINFVSLLGSYDQRGPGYARVSGVSADIGAFEVLPAAPTISSITFGDGTGQRSMVTQMVITFSEAVNFSGAVADAFTLFRNGTNSAQPGGSGYVTLTANPATGPAASVTITFSGPFTQFGSLIDGFYDVTVNSSMITGLGGNLDGESNPTFPSGDGVPGGNYSLTGNTTNKYFRLFGDKNGNGVTGLDDFAAFFSVFNLSADPAFDFYNDLGNVGLSDFAQFFGRFNFTP